MNTAKLKVTAVAVALLALVAIVVWQQRRVKLLMTDADVLRQQVEQSATLREENQRLAEQLRLASERSRADAIELARLRGQSLRLQQAEQENRLKSERDRSVRLPTKSPVPDNQTPEWPLVEVRMRFSKVLGLSIISFANDHKGQMPTNVMSAIASQTEKEFVERLADQLPPEAANHEIRTDQFELVFQGNLMATGREPGTTIIARAKEPVQLSNGRWARATVFDDGHGEVLIADSLDELAAKEKKWMRARPIP